MMNMFYLRVQTLDLLQTHEDKQLTVKLFPDSVFAAELSDDRCDRPQLRLTGHFGLGQSVELLSWDL